MLMFPSVPQTLPTGTLRLMVQDIDVAKIVDVVEDVVEVVVESVVYVVIASVVYMLVGSVVYVSLV